MTHDVRTDVAVDVGRARTLDDTIERGSNRLLELAGVATRQHVPAMDSLTINFAPNSLSSSPIWKMMTRPSVMRSADLVRSDAGH